MGTRCLTEIFDDDEKIVTIYRQFDGYPNGHLREICEHVKGKNLVNGFTSDQYGKVFNGMGCYAASLIEHLKQPHKTGNIYIVAPVGSHEGRWEDYLYKLRASKTYPGEIEVEVYERDAADNLLRVMEPTPLSEVDPSML